MGRRSAGGSKWDFLAGALPHSASPSLFSHELQKHLVLGGSRRRVVRVHLLFRTAPAEAGHRADEDPAAVDGLGRDEHSDPAQRKGGNPGRTHQRRVAVDEPIQLPRPAGPRPGAARRPGIPHTGDIHHGAGVEKCSKGGRTVWLRTAAEHPRPAAGRGSDLHPSGLPDGSRRPVVRAGGGHRRGLRGGCRSVKADTGQGR